MTISERVAYLKGLTEGMELDAENKKEDKIILEMIKVLEEVGYSLEDINTNIENLEDEIDAVSDDLQDVENIVYDDLTPDDVNEEDDPYYFDTVCPACGQKLTVDFNTLGEDDIVTCPNCGEKFALNFDDDDDEDEDEDTSDDKDD